MRNRANSKHSEVLLTSPQEIFTTLIKELQHARESIDMEFYIFLGDRIGNTITSLLRRKARQGVRVRLVVDGYGSRKMPRKMRQALTQEGVQLRVAHTFSHCRNHRKMVIIDQRTALVGGINIADRYVVGNELGVWYDAVLRIGGVAVAPLCRLFDYDFAPTANRIVPTPDETAHSPMLYWSESGGGGAMMRLLYDVIDGAERDIIFTTPYFMPPRGVLRHLEQAVERGVRASVIIPRRCDIWLIDDVMRHSIREAESLGIEVLLLDNAFIHAKLALVDTRRVVVGSANLDARSLGVNRELMLSSFNRTTCATAKHFLQRLRQMATPASDHEIKCYLPRFITRAITPLM
ncbi:MAG: phosphatidylserine/phosphatidylglycerophosphate/cardiolipin synthase family protein [Alistipes sp.]|nr:phosphatidylserine/phosphatidylglycerophosphate/cardiolipin synthase family protein [Alistipes sp.]